MRRRGTHRGAGPPGVVSADVDARGIAVRQQPGVRFARRLSLFHRNEVIARHHPELSDRVMLFPAPRTRAGDDALSLVAAGLLDDIRPVRRLDGAVGRFELVST